MSALTEAEVAMENTWTVAPNPFSSILRLDLKQSGGHTVKMYDMQGRVVLSNEMEGAQSHDLATENLGSGSYLLQVVSPDGNVSHRRVVHQ